MYTSICWYLHVLPVLLIPEVVDIGVKSYIEKHAICIKDYRITPFLSIQYVHGDLCKHIGIDSSTDLYDQIWCVGCSHEWGAQRHIFWPRPLGPGEGPKGQISFNIIKFQLQCQFQRF